MLEGCRLPLLSDSLSVLARGFWGSWRTDQDDRVRRLQSFHLISRSLLNANPTGPTRTEASRSSVEPSSTRLFVPATSASTPQRLTASALIQTTAAFLAGAFYSGDGIERAGSASDHFVALGR